MKDNRTNYTIDCTFVQPKSQGGATEEVMIYVPYDILMEVMVKYCKEFYDVEFVGTNNAIWNIFSDTNFIDQLFDDEDFVEAIKDRYTFSDYFKDDYEKWVEDYE